jgi:hypothetical protein
VIEDPASQSGAHPRQRLPLAPGYESRQLYSYLYAAFVTIGLLAFVSFFQTYLMNVNLGLPVTLQGRKGTFALQHNATMTRGEPYLNIIVVPDSGTGELAGLSGTMKIVIEAGGKHFYELDYALPDA